MSIFNSIEKSKMKYKFLSNHKLKLCLSKYMENTLTFSNN